MDLYGDFAKLVSNVSPAHHPTPVSSPERPPLIELFEWHSLDEQSPSTESRIVCMTCKNETRQTQAHVCMSCDVWPFCTKCKTLIHMALSCDCNLIQSMMKSRCEILFTWLLKTGESYRVQMSAIYEMIVSALTDGESFVLEAWPCAVDPILCDIVQSNYLSDLHRLRMEYGHALDIYTEFEDGILGIYTTRDLTAICTDYRSPTQFFIPLTQELEHLDTLCRAMTSKESRTRLDEAVTKAEKLVRLFKALPPRQQAEESGLENEEMKSEP